MRPALITSLIVVACGGTEVGTAPPDESLLVDVVGVEGTYRIVACASTTFFVPKSPGSPPCAAFFSGTTQIYVDSGQIVFKRDHSVTFIKAISITTNLNSPGLSPTTTKLVRTYTGTYVVATNGIAADVTEFSEGRSRLALAAVIPQRVLSSWPGPDSLVFDTSNGQGYTMTAKR
jgi:hypothetical protein